MICLRSASIGQLPVFELSNAEHGLACQSTSDLALRFVGIFWSDVCSLMPFSRECWRCWAITTRCGNPLARPISALIVDDEVTIAVQVNGKRRDEISCGKGVALLRRLSRSSRRKTPDKACGKVRMFPAVL
jgi:hypothetical protein